MKNKNYSEVFPGQNITTISDYFEGYIKRYQVGMSSLNLESLEKTFRLLSSVIEKKGSIFFCGNGGSAEISNHMECDHMKGVRANTLLKPRVRSLSSNVGIITAIANDIKYENIYSYQLESLASPEDVLITVSSSGNSPNIIAALKTANNMGLKTIALSGFDGGESLLNANINLHIPVCNYGIVEDSHQSILHILAQFIRYSNQISHPKNSNSNYY
jgi:phosphoheptose isomerase